MEIALTLAAVLGGLFFIFSYLKFALTGFRYHPVTGLLALIPVLNLITLPTLLDGKLIRVILFGIFGLILAIGAWFLGADKTLQHHISTLRGQPMLISSDEQKQASLSANDPKTAQQNTNASKNNSSEANASGVEAIAPQSVYISDLPKQALYSMEFIDAPVQQINTLEGRTVRIITRKDSITEGRVQKATPSSVFITKKGSKNIAHEMLISNIKQLQVLVKREAKD